MSQRRVQDVYPLSPLQEGMLFHSLYAPESGVYVDQLRAELLGPLDEAAFARAWRRVIERHSILRTAFVWKSQAKPLQAVMREIEMPLVRIDWRGLPEARQEALLEDLAAAERRRGFELGKAPLMRLAVALLGEGRRAFLWTVHHILLDGWSLPLLLSEVFVSYDAFCRGALPALPPVRPFADYIAWLGRQDAAAAEAFFRRELAGFEEPTPIGDARSTLTPIGDARSTPTPIGTDRSAGDQEGEIETVRARLDAAATAALEGAARAWRLTTNVVVLGAWAALLARRAGASEAVFGLTLSGRSGGLPGVESMVGLLINTLPLRVRLAPETPLGAWLAALQERQLELQHHEHAPLARAQAASEVPRGQPLFESLYVFENYPPGAAPGEVGGGLRLGEVSFAERANYPLVVVVSPAAELALRLDFDRSRFARTTAERLLDGFRRLVLAMADPASYERPVGELPLLSAVERQEIREWNATAAPLPALGLGALFAAQAAATPGAPALSSHLLPCGGELSYREVAGRAARLARQLVALGVGPEVPVALALPRGPEMVVATLAVVLAGGVYVPLDPENPEERLAFLVADTGARVAVLPDDGRPAGWAGEARVVRFPAGGGEGGSEPRDWNAPEALQCLPGLSLADDRQLAYVMYTSGSTGRPKGVGVTHRAVHRLVRETDYVSFGPGLRMGQAANPAFDATTFEIWGALLNGGCLVFLPQEVLLSPDGLAHALAAERVSTMFLTAALFHQVAREAPRAFAGMRDLLVGGDAVDPERAREVLAAGGPARLLNGYGPTETTTFAACYEIRSLPPGAASVPIGRPLRNGTLRVLDRDFRDVRDLPVGAVGELYIGGLGLARGYLGRTELTAERFVPDPGGAPGARLYRTGDLARRLPDGAIDFVGRADRQVKLRGFRIEPGEIEATLAGHPRVRQAAVVVREVAPGDRRLAAFVEPLPGVALDARELRAWTEAKLPAHMVPAAIVILDALPLSAVGKLDRRALAALPLPEQGAAGRAHVPPRTEAEATLARIWAEVLRIERPEGPSVLDSFFELGGDSILSIQIVARAQQAGLAITPKQLFENPTIEALAEIATGGAKGEAAEAGETHEESAGPVPLTPIQRWFFGLAPRCPHHWNQSLLLEPRGITAEIAERALDELARHHGAFALRFTRSADGGWGQTSVELAPGAGFPLRRIDLSALGERAGEALAQANAAVQASLDLARGPLARAAWIDLPDGQAPAGQARLLLAVHHLIVDGVSWRVLLADLDAACRLLGDGRAPALPPPSASFRRWAERLAAAARDLTAEEVESEVAWWSARAARQAVHLGADRPEGDDTAGRAATVTVSLDAEETAALLREAPAAYRTRVEDLLLAALALALGQGATLAVDLEGHGRDALPGLDLSRTAGWFTEIAPVWLEADPADPERAVKAVKEQLRAADARAARYGLLRWLREDAGPRLAALPRPEVSFNYLGQLDQAIPAGALFAPAPEPAGPAADPSERRTHPLVIGALVASGRLRIDLTYGSARFDRATVEGWAASYLAQLRRLIALCRAAVRDGRFGYTPSDFPLAALAQRELDDLARGAEGPIDDVYPLSPLQEGILFHALYAPDSGVYVEQVLCEIVDDPNRLSLVPRTGTQTEPVRDGRLDPAVIEEAWRRVVARHPILRTSFRWRDLARPLQVVHARAPVRLEREDWSALSPAETERRLAELLAADRARGFDLGRPPLMRWRLVKTGPGSYRFLWSHHHVLLDGWSYTAVVSEFFAACSALRQGAEPALPRRRPYRDYIAWLERQDLAVSERYWRQALAGFTEPTPLAVERRAGGSISTAERAPRAALLGRERSAALQAQARGAGLTLNTLVQGAWALLLGRLAGRPEVVFGATVSGRPADLPGVETMVGLFINTLPVRVETDGRPLAGWLAALQARQVEMRQHEHSPLAKVQAWSEVPRGTALFESILVFESYPREATMRQGGGDLGVVDALTIERTNYPLTAAAVPGDDLLLHVDGDPARFDTATADRMLGHLTTLLAGMAAGAVAADLPSSALAMLTPAERHQLVVEWNDTAAPEPDDDRARTLHGPFLAQAARRPRATAIVCGERAVSYGEVAARARALARFLRSLGIGRGDRVGVWMHRGVEIVPALLGVVEAGAAYVPLEPDWPAERAAYILGSLAVRCLLTDARQLRAARELQWRLPALDHVVCLDVAAPRPEPEPIDDRAVREFWDDLAERAVDRVTAGGFVSSYTGRPFSEAEVDEYRDRVVTIARRHLPPGGRVLEVGCGSGLVTFELAPQASRYVALDPSPATQARNRERAAALGLARLEIATGFAHEIDRYPEGAFDLVVVASTVQFFPGLTYLERFVESALARLVPGGALVLADVMDARRREELSRSLDEYRGVHRGEADGRTRTHLGSELYVDPGVFYDLAAALPELGPVEVLERTEGFGNELRFRYDVVLEKAAAGERGVRREPRKRLWTAWAVERAPELALPAVTPESLAYIIFTSGSTGAPKGVAISHRSAAFLIHWVNTTWGAGPGDRVLWVTSPCFDLSVYDVFGLLAAGGSLHVAAEADLRDPQGLAATLALGEITFWDSAPAALAQVAAFFPAPGAAAGQGRLRLVFLSGDWVPVPLPDQVRRSFPNAQVVALGGGTEATIWSNSYDVGLVDPAWPSIPYGRPMPNARYHVLDRDLRPAPIGAPGDLYIGGLCLARGYADPAQTADRFIPDPLDGELSARLYRTGDRARYLADGNLEFLGRSDQQVKIRGYRIEQGEIEATLARHPELREAVVAVREDVPGDRRLVAYVVPHRMPGPPAAELRAFVRERLPEYMVPAAFVALAAMPVTANGKLDRKALPAPEWGGEAGRRYVPPRTPTEELLAGIWAEVLGIDRAGGRVGVLDNFFELGGDSILSIQVIARAMQAGCQVTPRQLFDHPTVAGLAAVAGTAAAVEAEQGPVVGPVPLTPIQRWFWEGDPTDRHHFAQAVLLVPQGVSPAAVEESFAALLDHHDALRLRFVEGPEGVRQANAPPGDGPRAFGRADLSALGYRAPEALAAATAAAQAGFDLARGPLARALWIDLPPGSPEGDARLLLAIHHLAVDGVSWRVLLGDLEAACRRIAGGAHPAPPPKTTSFKRWAERLAERARSLEGPKADALAGHWLARAERPRAALPVDRPEGDRAAGTTRAVSVALAKPETSALLHDVPAAYRTRIDEVLLAALARAVAEAAGAPEAAVWIDLEGHGREEQLVPGVDLTRTVGWLTSLHPVCLEVPADDDPGADLRAVKEQLRAVPDRGFDFGLLRHLRGDARLAALPPAEIAWNYLGRLDRALVPGAGDEPLFAPAPEPAGPPESPRRRRPHEIAVNARVSGGALRVDFAFGAARLDTATVERLAERFLAALRVTIAHCLAALAAGRTVYTPSDFPLAGLAAMPPDEVERVVGEGGQVREATPSLEDLYPLSPLQEGILFHALFAPGSGVYVEQLLVEVAGELDAEAVELAWQHVADRTPALRTGFHWEGLARPLQAVAERVEIAIERLDWTTYGEALTPQAEEERLADLLARDRARGFDLHRPPLMRWTLIKTGEREGRMLWRFLWTHHHLLLDGWSYAALTADFLAAYEALHLGVEPRLPARRPYRDYVAWLGTRDLAAAEPYWRRVLAGFREPTPLPADRRPAGETPARRPFDARLDPAETAALQAEARRRGLTLNSLVQAAWGLVLGRQAGRYGAREEAVFGATVSGRPAELAGAESIIGLFINTLPVRLDLAPGAPLLAWLQALQASQAELRQHEATPLTAVQEWSDVPRGLPLFESILAFENFPRDASLRQAGGSLGIAGVTTVEQTNYPLTVLAIPGEGLSFRVAYDPARFDRTTVARLADHLGTALRAMREALAAGGESLLGDISLLDTAERHQLLVEWNDTGHAALPETATTTLHELFLEAARRAPEAVALVFGEAQVTYGELERRSAAGARRLGARGAGRGGIVGLAVERSPEMAALVLAVLRAGAAYVALDPEHPPARLARLLADAACRLAVADPELAPRLAGFDGEVALTSEILPEIQKPGGDEAIDLAAPQHHAGPLDAAYAVYTSGSTGRPKGILAHHGGAAAYLRWVVEQYGISPKDVALQLAPLTFDASVRDLFAPLSAGARLVLVPRDVVRDPEALAAAIARHGVTCLPSIVPSLLRRVAESAMETPPPTGTVRLLLAAGERLYGADGAAARAAFGTQARLFNQYGASECTMSSTFAEVTEDLDDAATAPVGRPIEGAWIAVLDRSLAPLPLGVVGEVAIGGPGLTYGYLGQPERTAEAFVPDPLGLSGSRLYLTGDLGRLLADGRLEYLGRVDQQVKIRGQRVEPGEVEALLREHPEVGDAAVIVRETGTGDGTDARLAAFVVAREGSAPAVAALRAFLAERLPDYMLPADWAFLPALPLSAHNKVDRQALALLKSGPERGFEKAARQDARERTPVEDLVAGVWCEVLGHDWVGLDESFFELGGHSLLATRVTSRLRQVLGVELPVRALFVAPTVAALAAEIERARTAGKGEAAAPPLLPLPPESRAGALAPSFAQERLWFLDQLAPGSPTYNMPLVLQATGALSCPALAASLAGLAARHETLRTTFAATRSGPAQRVAPPPAATDPAAPAALPLVDLSALPAARREAAAEALAGEEALRPFDLARGPLLRATLLRVAPEHHVVLFTMHHVVSDGWSLGVLVGDLGALYAAAVEGAAPRLPPLPVQYADFAAWQRGWLAGERLQSELRFWRERLAGAPPELALPLDRPRPAMQGFRGGQIPVRLDRDLSRAALALARREGASLFMVLLSAVACLLSRVAGQEDVVVGTGVANRNRLETERLIGFFVNSLALRVDLAGDPTFAGLLSAVRETTLSAYAHQDLPFEKLVAELRPERSLARSPIFQVMLVLQNAPMEALDLPGLALAPVRSLRRTAKFDLTLSLAETPQGIGGFWEYDADLFDPTTVARLAGHFETLLGGAVARAAAVAGTDRARGAIAGTDRARGAISALPLLSAAEVHQLVVAWNDSDADYPRDRGAGELFAEVAAARPGAVALDYAGTGGGTTTYAELAERAGRLAALLVRRGVRPGGRVALCLERSAEMIVAIVAAVQAGAVYVPLDPAHPRERLAFLVDDCRAAAVVTEERLLTRLPSEAAGRFVVLERARAETAALPPLAPVATGGGAPAYVLYTSGSTGRPKGVVVPHRAVVRLVRGADYVELGPGDRMAQAASPSFDISTWEIWGALLAGGTLVGIARETALSPRLLAEEFRARGVTAAVLAAAVFHQVAAELPDAFAGLSHLLVGGEPLDPSAARRVLQSRPPARLLDVYGPTEAAVYSTWEEVREVPAGVAAVPVGRPVANTRVYVLDARLRPVPIGVEGEIFVGGDALSLGYLDRPELDAERFVASPYVPCPRLYRTGDRGRFLADGRLDYRGRLDQQVKLRGVRIELGEVEAALAELPGVAAAAVLLRDDLPEGRGLVGYVVGAVSAASIAAQDAAPVATEAAMPAAAALREALRARLPEAMVPARFVALAALPLTVHGKVDRRALAALPLRPKGAEEGEARAFVPPRTPAEELVAGVFAEVLGRERVGADESFFDLGGHSLLGAQVASRLREAIGLEVPLRWLFEQPTARSLGAQLAPHLPAGWTSAPRAATAPDRPAALAGGADQATAVAVAPGQAAAVAVAPDHPQPLSFAQERLWFLDRLLPGTPLYNVPVALELAGDLDPGLLAGALSALVARHEALRTTFDLAPGGAAPVARVQPPAPLVPPLVDLSALAAPRREALAQELADAAARRPFDLARGPVVAALLVRVEPRRHLALLTVHHIATDGWSTGIVVREVAELYAAAAAGRPPRLPALAWQYGDYATWQRRRLGGDLGFGLLDAELAFWREALAGAPEALDLPLDRPRPEAPAHRVGSVRVRLPQAALGRLAALAQEEGATLFMVLLAAFQTLLGRASGQEDVVVGTPIAGRNRLELEPLVGLFLNTLPLRARLAGEPPFRALLAQVRETTLAAYAHQELPFERLVAELNPERSLARAPLFQALFALQNLPFGSSVALPGLTMTPRTVAGGGAKFDLSLFLSESPEGLLLGDLAYDADLFDDTSARRLAVHLAILWEAVAADAERPISRLPLLSDPERQQIFWEWNAVPPEEPTPPTTALHELVFAQAARTPRALAVAPLGGGERLTYGELAARARRLAAALRARGVGTETVVGLAAERSPAMIAGMLGILAAGGAYLPLDPAYPEERLAWIAADAGAALVLATARVAPRIAALGGAGDSLPVAVVEDLLAAPVPDDLEDLEPPALDPRNLAYVLYTSGSTGRPKGVAVEHRNAVAFLAWVRERYAPADLAGVVAVTSIGFDVSVFELFAPLASGGAVLLAESALDLVALAEIPPDLPRPTLVNAVPSALAELLHAGFTPPPDAILHLAGEAVPRALVERLFAGGRRAPVYNLYGPTEDTTYSTIARLAPGEEPTVGRPIAGERSLVLDAHGELAPIGVAGEVWIGGAGLTRGYLGRPDLTADRFRPAPWGSGARNLLGGELGARSRSGGELGARSRSGGELGARLYRTGDRARLRADGEIEYLGRLDHQVKVRGVRIELGEIEAALTRLPGVAQSAVLVAGEGEERRLVAYVGTPGGGVDATSLRESLKRLLPAPMVPAAFVLAGSLPLTASGKVDRQALAARGGEPVAREEVPYVPPSNPMEELLAEIWQELLGVERVGAADHFFDLGGHSLQGIRLMSRIAEVFGVTLPVKKVFEAPRLRELAVVVAEEMLREAEELEVGQPA